LASLVSRSRSNERSVSDDIRGVARLKENPLLNERTMNAIFVHLDELSSCWSELKIGQSMTVRWPDLMICADLDEIRRQT
jgi:hypothetical protein